MIWTVCALIAYGSLFPFAYVAHAASWMDVRALLTAWPSRLSMADAAGNVLLFMPLGALAAFQARQGRRRLAWLAGGVFYAWAVQYLQFWFPSRVPSASDAWFNTAGLCAGMLLADLVLRPDAPRRGWRVDAAPYRAPATALLLAWVAYRWYPLVPSLDPQNFKNGLKPLLLAPRWDGVRALHDTAAWLMWFQLLWHSPWRGMPGIRVALAALCVIGAEPFIWGNTVSLSNVAGLGAALLARPLFAPGRSPPWVLPSVIAASLLASGLAPWVFEPRARKFLWMPFAGMLDGSMYVNTAALAEKCFLYGGLVFLIGCGGVGFRRAGGSAAVLLGAIEIAQRWVPGRVPEITDPLLAVMAGLVFTAVAPAPGRPACDGAEGVPPTDREETAGSAVGAAAVPDAASARPPASAS